MVDLVDTDVAENIAGKIGPDVQRVCILASLSIRILVKTKAFLTINAHAVAFRAPSTVPLMLMVGIIDPFAAVVALGEPIPVTVVDAVAEVVPWGAARVYEKHKAASSL